MAEAGGVGCSGPAKRSASPRYAQDYTGPESSQPGKRCRQLTAGSLYIWQSNPSSKAQLSTALRRVQSAPVATETLEQQTWDDLEHWRSREQTARRPCPERMGAVQTEITPAMRTMLVDWLGEVRDEFRLHSETLFLAASYLDAFLATKPVPRGRFQLLGMACLWVAAKFEEVYSPPLESMLAMAENQYSADDMRAMEKEVLFTLDFGLSVPTPLRFLHYVLQLAQLPAHPAEAQSCRRLAEALLELTLLDAAFLGAPASAVAAAAVYLALGLVRHHAGLQGVVLLSGAEPAVLGELVKRLSKGLHDAAQQPQPCALLFRYKAWEGLHGGAALAIASATAGAASSSSAPTSAPAAAVIANFQAQTSQAYPAAAHPHGHVLQQHNGAQNHHLHNHNHPYSAAAAAAGGLVAAAAAALHSAAPPMSTSDRCVLHLSQSALSGLSLSACC